MTTSPPAIELYSDRSAGGELLRLRSFVSIGKRDLLHFRVPSSSIVPLRVDCRVACPGYSFQNALLFRFGFERHIDQSESNRTKLFYHLTFFLIKQYDNKQPSRPVRQT